MTTESNPASFRQAPFLARLRAAREDAKRSGRKGIVSTIAHRTGKTSAAVRHYFSGQRTPDITDIPVIADVLGVEIGTLFGEEPKERGDVDQADLLEAFLKAPDALHDMTLQLLRAKGRTPETIRCVVAFVAELQKIKPPRG